jgi:N-acetylglucosamine-6-phosphate deacetylase
MFLTNAKIFTGQHWLIDAAIQVENGIIQGIVNQKYLPNCAPKKDLKGQILTAGLLDTQIYGGDGLLFADNLTEVALERIERYLMATGTAGFLITLPSVPFSIIEKAIEVVSNYLPKSKGALLGLHVEGPYINPEKKGAHREDWIKKPEKREVNLLINAANRGIVRFITLAPEMVEVEVIKQFLAAGIIVSAGHTQATYEQYLSAFAAGVKHVTHLYNAMPQVEGRKPGLMAAIMDAPQVQVSIIADGQHVHFPSFRLAKKVLGDQLYVITDAVTGTDKLKLKNGAYFNEKDILTGSAMTLPSSIRNCVEHIGISLEEAIRMVTLYPAKAMGMEANLGSIEVGKKAIFTIFDEKMNYIGNPYMKLF